MSQCGVAKVIAPGETAGKDLKKPRIIQYVVVRVPLDAPEGEAGAPHNLMRMKGHFGTDVTLEQPGVWPFEITAKLAVGQLRQYDADYLVK